MSGERIVKNAKLQYFIYVYTIINVNITFDPAKNEVNIAKHEVSLALAAEFEWDTAVTWPDTRKDYGEARVACLGYAGLRIYAMVFVDRMNERRIISLRKANRREVERYAQT